MKFILQTFVLLLATAINAAAQVPAETIPNFTFYKLDKVSFSNKNLEKGKKSFFVFFDSDCDHCQHAVSAINRDFKKFANVSVHLISLDSKEKITHFMSLYGAKIKGKNVTILQDSKGEFLPKFKPRKYPSMFLFSKDGKLIVYEDNEDSVFRIIKQLNN